MVRLACVSLVLASVALADHKEVRFHDISFLTAQIKDHPGDNLGSGGPDAVAAEENSTQPFTPGEIVDLVKAQVSPEAWEDHENAIDATPNGLSVRAPADVQEGVSRLLAQLAASMGPQIEVRVRRVRVSADLLARLAPSTGSPALDEGRLKTLDEALGGKGDAAAASDDRIVAFPGQRVHVKDATVVSYVSGYEAEVAQQSVISKPIPSDVQQGTISDVRPFLSPDGALIAIECRIRSVSLLSVDSFDTGTPHAGVVQLPDVQSTSLGTCLLVPDRGTVLAAWRTLGTERKDEKLRYECVLVSATRLGPAPQGPPKNGSKPLRVIDLGFLSRAIPDFAPPSIGLPRRASGGKQAGASFTIDDSQAVPGQPPDDIKSQVSNLVAPDTWSADNLLEVNGQGRLLAKNSAEAMAQLDAFLASMTRVRARSVSVGVTYLAIDAGAYAALVKAGQPLAAGAVGLTAEQANELTARSGTQELGGGWLTGFPGEQVSLGAVRSKAFVSDYDVQIATQAKIGEPVIGVATTGLLLDVRAQAQEDGKRLLLDLHPTLAESAAPMKDFDTQTGDIGKVQLPSVRTQETRTSLVIDNGGFAVLGISTRPAENGTEQVILLVHAAYAEVR